MVTQQTNLITKLNSIASSQEETLRKAVAKEALEQSGNDNEVCRFFINLLTHGCISGMISSLVYYRDTHPFFDTHYDEIEDLRQYFEEEVGQRVAFNGDLKNTLAWFGFEETARQLAEELDIGS